MIDLNTDQNTEAPPGSEPLRCGGLTRQGVPCRSPIVDRATGYCVTHDPERELEVEAWRVLGGKATSVEAQIERKLLESGDLGAVAGALTQTIAELRQEPMSPNVANAIASVSRAYLGVRQEAVNEKRMARVLALLEEKLGGVVDVSEWTTELIGDDDDEPSS